MADELELDESGNPIVFFDISLGGELPLPPFLFVLFRLRPAAPLPPSSSYSKPSSKPTLIAMSARGALGTHKDGRW